MRFSCAVALAVFGSGCVSGYQSALGYRARQAVLRGDIAAFEELMNEAAEKLPSHPLDNPKRTVLTHFLDFGGHDRFFPLIEVWTERGWVSENMTCAIHRARYRGTIETDAVEAERAADVCVDRAREAAEEADRRWELEACLEEAPFLVQSSTLALSRFLAVAADPTEPILLRSGLLDGMTRLYLQDPATLSMNDATLTRPAAVEKSRAQLDATEARFIHILAAVRASADPGLIAGATAFGAIELERVSIAHGRSLLGGFATSGSPDDGDLAWAWVRAIKSKKKNARLYPLGLWDRKREPAGDAYWYVCAGEGAGSGGGASASAKRRDAITVLAEELAPDPEALRLSECTTSSGAAALPHIFGPYPLEVSARVSVTASTSAQLVIRARKKAKVRDG